MIPTRYYQLVPGFDRDQLVGFLVDRVEMTHSPLLLLIIIATYRSIYLGFFISLQTVLVDSSDECVPESGQDYKQHSSTWWYPVLVCFVGGKT